MFKLNHITTLIIKINPNSNIEIFSEEYCEYGHSDTCCKINLLCEYKNLTLKTLEYIMSVVKKDEISNYDCITVCKLEFKEDKEEFIKKYNENLHKQEDEANT